MNDSMNMAAVEAALSGKFEIVAEIGHGGNAIVYLAIQKNLDRRIALKVLLPRLARDIGFLERFHREARAIAMLRHPNIVTIYDEGNEGGIHYMAMEFLEGKDLHKLVEDSGGLSVGQAVKMVRCIASALDCAHEHGVIHRDVKSSNIILTSPDTSILTDFGIAQSGYTSTRPKEGGVLGTPEFMSPEQITGKPLDARTDFYSLGVVLYHTLSRKYPFRGSTPLITIDKILHEDPVPIGNLVNLPEELETVINRCLMRDPAERVQTGQELIEMLDAPQTETLVLPAPLHDVPVRTAQSKTPRAPVGATFALAVVACASIFGYRAWKGNAAEHEHLEQASIARTAEPALRQVPNVVGIPKDEAIGVLQNAGFCVGEMGVVAVPDTNKRGRVDTQRPAQGSLVKPGATVDILVGE